MSQHEPHEHQEPLASEPDPADSRADTIAAFCAIAIAVCAAIFFVSQH